MTVIAPGTSPSRFAAKYLPLKSARRLQIGYQPTDAMGAGSCGREPERCSIPVTTTSRANA